MADYYTRVSFVVKCTEDEAKKLTDAAAQYDAANAGDPVVFTGLAAKFIEQYPPEDYSFGVEFGIADAGEMWIHDSDGCPSLDLLGDALEEWLKEIGSDQVIAFQWSNDCSKPRIDAYGGGATIITRHGQHWVNTTQWIDEKVKELGLAGVVHVTE